MGSGKLIEQHSCNLLHHLTHLLNLVFFQYFSVMGNKKNTITTSCHNMRVRIRIVGPGDGYSPAFIQLASTSLFIPNPTVNSFFIVAISLRIVFTGYPADNVTII